MANEHLRRASHHVKGDAEGVRSWWWYEENGGIRPVIEVKDRDGNYCRTVQVLIPWASIRKALARKDRAGGNKRGKG